MEPTKTFHFLKWTIAAALVIVINLFFHYAIASVYHEPKFEDFCKMTQAVYSDANTCVGNGGRWTNNQMAPAEITKAVKDGQALGWCDVNFTCNKNYNDTHSIYNRNVFIVLIVLSLAVLIGSVFVPIEVLSLGFSWAGVLSLIIATAQYWSDANNWMRVVILGIAIAVLIWIAIKKFKV